VSEKLKCSSNRVGITCTVCASSAICPLGAIAEIDSIELKTISQAQVYPKSPESTIFDEILECLSFTTNWSPQINPQIKSPFVDFDLGIF
jgi:formate hydrogenlyase subunit 6/NADH:ubiquinone oxidoreductase subunit I